MLRAFYWKAGSEQPESTRLPFHAKFADVHIKTILLMDRNVHLISILYGKTISPQQGEGCRKRQ